MKNGGFIGIEYLIAVAFAVSATVGLASVIGKSISNLLFSVANMF